jgi:hypothetical protein
MIRRRRLALRCADPDFWTARTHFDIGYTACLSSTHDQEALRHGNSAALVVDKALLDILKVRLDTLLEVTTDGKTLATSALPLALPELKHGAVLGGRPTEVGP